jgi:small-conductance mechanosensitive channel
MTIIRQKLILTLLWWIWGLSLFALLAMISYQPAIFGEDADAAWQWFLPNITPTMMLVGAVAYIKRGDRSAGIDARGPVFLISLIVSIFYLVALTVAILSVFYSTDPLGIMRKSGLWLGPLQGLTASFLGIFFTDSAPKPPKN